MIQSTWYKHYILTECSWARRPVYFFYGRFSEMQGKHHIQTEQGFDLLVNDLFLSWLQPVDETDKPKMRQPKSMPGRRSSPLNTRSGGISVEKAMSANATPASSASASLSWLDSNQFKRLFGR